MNALRLYLPLVKRCFTIGCLCTQMAFIIPGNTEHLKCPYDTAGDHMRTAPAPLHPERSAEQAGYFARPIPAKVHQIWFGGAWRMDGRNTEMWRVFGEMYGYDYRLWTEADAEQLRGMMSEENYALFQQFMRLGNYHGASDVARLAILEGEGGVYVDVDIRPPNVDGRLVDLRELVPMQNIVFMTEKSSRNVIESSMFVANGFIMSAPGHPLLKHLNETIVGNCSALLEGPIDASTSSIAVHPMYLSGPFFVSRSLAGVFTVIPFNYATAYNMREYEPGAN